MACRHVMIVEDDAEIRNVLRDLLELEGYQVHTAENGKVGLEALEALERPPCLIILDLMMPVMNGWEFLEARGSCPWQELACVPVVIVSAVGENLKMSRGRAEAFIRKPFDFDQLLDVVRRYCESSPGLGLAPEDAGAG